MVHQDGVVVVPAAVAQEVYDIAHSREVIEGIIKEQVRRRYVFVCVCLCVCVCVQGQEQEQEQVFFVSVSCCKTAAGPPTLPLYGRLLFS